MANYCCFDAKITGRKTDILEFIDMLRWKGKYKDAGLGRIFSCEYDNHDLNLAGSNDILSVIVYGDCAWSVKCAMMEEYTHPSIESETKRLNLVMEIYSQEPGMQFQEHILCDRGELLIDDCVDWELHVISMYSSLAEYNENEETDFTEDMIDEDGDIQIGGYENYGDFKHFRAEHFK